MRDYIVGIDLGTSNTVVAYAAPGEDRIRLLEIEQLVAPGEVAARPLLPSVRYHPAQGELRPEDLRLPWNGPEAPGEAVTGVLARELGAQVPGRLVASAKSWLSHGGVDRGASILPWGAPDEIPKVSPVAASASFLAHVRSAWNLHHPDAPLERQEVVLTVPASFDEGARALTLEAARLAGLVQPRLLEEPLAAFHDWTYVHRERLAEALGDSRLVLVCDVGGGTTDLTLIQAALRDGESVLARVGVGDHLMLGGDNMDLALAHLLEPRLGGEGQRLSATRFSQLVARCRAAKEQLLADEAPERSPVTLLGGGARLVGGARTVELGREEVRALVLDGFLPRVAADEPLKRGRAAVVEFGLPYPADPAITRHVAAFLRRHAEASRRALGDRAPGEEATPVPDTVLFNGGVFRAGALAGRLLDALGAWRGAPLRRLRNDEPDLAVARGAVAYALGRRGRGVVIGGGAARSYFLVLADRPGRQGVCVLPRGTEEGREVALAEHSFALRTGQPVSFRLASTVADAAYRPGELAALGDDFIDLPPLAMVLEADRPGGPREVPVGLATTMTDIGTLQMHCVAREEGGRRWLLEFQVRGADAAPGAAGAPPAALALPARFPAAVEALERVFGSPSQQVGPKEVKQLRGQLEHLLGKRAEWDLALSRALYDAVWERARRRRRSAEHERLWLNLAGYCLRPGFGDPLDEWRAGQLWALYGQGLQYVKESQNWSEWWTLWRRVAGGLDEAAQLRVLDDIEPFLDPGGSKAARGSAGAARMAPEDMLRLAALLERVPAPRKVEVGDRLLERLERHGEKPEGWWTLGRLGARDPLYGSAHNVVPPEVAMRWLERVCGLSWKKVEPAAFAAAQLARLTGDRSRDLPPAVREDVAQRLTASGAPQAWTDLVRTGGGLDMADERRAFGEGLPAGLRLLGRTA